MKFTKLAALFKKRNISKNRIKKNSVRGASNVYYSPAENISSTAVAIGAVFRTLVVYFGTFGISLFICEAAGMNTCDWWDADLVTPGKMALLAILPAVFSGLASVNRIFAIASPVIYAGLYSAYVTLFCPGNVISFTVDSAVRAYNCMMYTISEHGYLTASELMVNDGFDYSGVGYEHDPYMFGGAFLVATLIGIFLYFTVQKKVRVIPLAIGMTAIIAPILTYNVAKGNVGFGFMTVFICGAVAMKIYDRNYGGTMQKKSDRKKLRAKKKEEKAKKRLSEKKEKLRLKIEAEKMFNAALDAEMGLKRSKLAKKAVYKAKKDEIKKEKAAKKLAEKAEKEKRKEEKKETAAKIKEIRKAAAKIKKEKGKEEAEKFLLDNCGDILKKDAEKKNRIAIKRRDKRKISMAGGFAGFGVCVIVLLAMWIPMSAVKGEFRIIEPLNEKITLIRDYVTEKLSGNYVDLNDDYIYEDFPLYPSVLSFEPVKFKKERMFQVETTSAEHNIYLRSRAFRDYDAKSGAWSTADFSEIVNFRRDYGKDFSPDMIKTGFYHTVYPSSAELEGTKNYKNFTGFGFTVQQVNTVRRNGYSKLLFVPTFMDTDTGILKYGTADKTKDSYSSFFDGMYSSGDMARTGAGFGAVSFVTTLSRRDVVDANIEMSLEYFRRSRDVILENYDKNLSDDDITSLVYSYEKSLSDDGITYTGTSIVDRFFYSMTEDEQYSLLDLFDTEKAYSQYAHTAYTEKSGSNTVKSVAEKILTGAKEKLGKEKLTANELAMAVVDYFRSGEYTYTEAPDETKYDGEKNILDAFLIDVKEGYCTHFATAATMILREYGIPARLAEGYVADDFNIAIGGKTADYRSYVDDDDAHAWVEVYIDGMGWAQYEVTPGKLSDDMYSHSDATVITDPADKDDKDIQSDPFGKDDITHHENTDHFDTDMEPDKFESELKWFIKGIIILGIISVLIVGGFFIIRHITKKAQDALGERYRIIDRCRNPETFKNPQNDLHWLQRKLNDIILDIFTLIGIPPETGETPEEYGERLFGTENVFALSSIDIRDVISAIEKEEFGHGLTEEEMTLCANYADDLITSVYDSLGIFAKIKLRYLKRKL